MHGVPVLAKDNYDVAGVQTTGGSRAMFGWVPQKDATIIAKLRAAGAIVIAKVTMSEWARGGVDNINSALPGFARNPYNTAYATGGSSGGTDCKVKGCDLNLGQWCSGNMLSACTADGCHDGPGADTITSAAVRAGRVAA